jgi:hypothetical protein
MTDESGTESQSSARGEAAWKQAREAVAARNQQAQKVGREERQAWEQRQDDARRAAEGRRHAQLLSHRRKP